ncbi:MAG: hypothetical protein FWF52_09060 [Candidatus Azobacteroides sp.]|nr:hypothetical protein [Candidatus Azobacteroides sp.]
MIFTKRTKTRTDKQVSNNYRRYYMVLVLLLIFNLCFSQIRLDAMIYKFNQAEWSEVRLIKDSIENLQKEAIPMLIELLKDTSYVKLKNTADLIYPGAETFYGHGGVVYYDIDWICVRAAWVLEEITFQNFGYRNLTINEEQLMDLHIQNYNSYLQTGSHDIDFKDKTSRQKLIEYRLMLANQVSEWWNENKDTWTRFNAIKEALSSNDEERQILVLHYLRFGKTKCDGLTLENYLSELEPLVKKIKQNESERAKLQANHLLDDKEYDWFKIKNGN